MLSVPSFSLFSFSGLHVALSEAAAAGATGAAVPAAVSEAAAATTSAAAPPAELATLQQAMAT